MKPAIIFDPDFAWTTESARRRTRATSWLRAFRPPIAHPARQAAQIGGILRAERRRIRLAAGLFVRDLRGLRGVGEARLDLRPRQRLGDQLVVNHRFRRLE